MIDLDRSPEATASRLAKYMTDPSAVRAGVANYWGRQHAPSVSQCAKLIHQWRTPKREAKPEAPRTFRCGHLRIEENEHVTESGAVSCLTCRREMERQAAQRYRERKAKAAAQKVLREALEKVRAEKQAKTRYVGMDDYLRNLLLEASSVFSMSVADICGPEKGRHYSAPRFAISYIARSKGYSYPIIGDLLGGRDHSTIVHATKKAQQWAAEDKDFASRMARLAAAV